MIINNSEVGCSHSEEKRDGRSNVALRNESLVVHSDFTIPLQQPGPECGIDTHDVAPLNSSEVIEIKVEYSGSPEHRAAWYQAARDYIQSEKDPVLRAINTKTVNVANKLVFGSSDAGTFVEKYSDQFELLRSDLESWMSKVFKFPVPSTRWDLYGAVLNNIVLQWVDVVEKHKPIFGILRNNDADSRRPHAEMSSCRDRFRSEVKQAQLLYNMVEVGMQGLLSSRISSVSKKVSFNAGPGLVSDKGSDFLRGALFNFDPSFGVPWLQYVFLQLREYTKGTFTGDVRAEKRTIFFGTIDERRAKDEKDPTPFIETVPGPAGLEPEIAGARGIEAGNIRRIIRKAGLTEREQIVISRRFGIQLSKDGSSGSADRLTTSGDSHPRELLTNVNTSPKTERCDALSALAEIGKDQGVTRERIRQIEVHALKKMRKAISRSGGYDASNARFIKARRTAIRAMFTDVRRKRLISPERIIELSDGLLSKKQLQSLFSHSSLEPDIKVIKGLEVVLKQLGRESFIPTLRSEVSTLVEACRWQRFDT